MIAEKHIIIYVKTLYASMWCAGQCKNSKTFIKSTQFTILIPFYKKASKDKKI